MRDTVNLRQVAESGRPLIIGDTRDFAGWIETPQTAWVRSYLCGPLRIRDQVVGFFNLDSAVPGFFTNAHAERLMAFAAQAAVAIENARLYEETHRRLQDQSLLYEAGQAISSTLEFNQVLETMSQQLVRATNAQIDLDPAVGSRHGSGQDDLSEDADDGRPGESGFAGEAVCADRLPEGGPVSARSAQHQPAPERR